MFGLALATILTMQSTSADIIGNFDSLDFDAPSVPGNGQFDSPATITVDTSGLFVGSSTGSIVYNLTGLDITGDLTANDTASFTFNVSAAGGNIANATSGTRIGIDGNGAGGLSDPSEVLTFSYN